MDHCRLHQLHSLSFLNVLVAGLAVGALLVTPDLAPAVPIRSSDFTEHERVLSLGMEDETVCESQAGDDLLAVWYGRLAAAPFGIAGKRAKWGDPSRVGVQLALDLGRSRRPWLDVHLAGWATEAGAAAASIEARWTIPLCGWNSAVIPYLGSSMVSERFRRYELDHDATAWAGVAVLTPNLYPYVAGKSLGNPDRFDIRLRLSLQGDALTDPRPPDRMEAVLPRYQAGIHGMLGWTILRGFSFTHERRRAPPLGTKEKITSFGVYFGSAESRFHPFVRGRWLRLGSEYADDLTAGLTVRLLSN